MFSNLSPCETYQFFDALHWKRVREVRRQLNPVGTPPPKVSHPLVGTTLKSTRFDHTYLVESVQVDWRNGRFLRAMLNMQGSHRVVLVKNISSTDQEILDQIARFGEEFPGIEF